MGIWNLFLEGYLGNDVVTPDGNRIVENPDGVDVINGSRLNLLLTQYYILKEQLVNRLELMDEAEEAEDKA